MRVLVGCEYSGIVRDEFIAAGHDAWSCDLLPSERPGPHIQDDIRNHLDPGSWDMLIAFPPCTYICNGAQSNITRRPHLRILEKREAEGIPFFMAMADSEIQLSCIENPIGVMSTRYRKPDQIIRPFMFGHEYNKDVCLWLKGLPKLVPTNLHPGPYKKLDFWSTKRNPEGKSLKSKTFPGIARAMAEQWGKLQPIQKVA